MSRDNALQRAVLAALRFEPSVNAAHIGVAVDDGVVTLTGHVNSYAQKHAAEAATALVRGVRAVAEEIEVRLPFESRRTDDEIAAAAADRLFWDSALPRDGIAVKVEKGWVTLTGDVDWRFQKEMAQDDVRRLHGVIGVSNQLRVRPSPPADDIREQILDAFHRSWLSDPGAVDVRVEGSEIRLGGTVRFPQDRRLAAALAWGVAGVTDVRNEIEIG